jgi:general secretion pathway protein D
VLLGLVATLAAAETPRHDATIALNFQAVELPVLAQFVSEVTGRNFILDDRVRGSVTIIAPNRITPDEAYLVFQSVLQVKGFTTVPSGSFVKIVPVRDARETTVPTGGSGADAVVTRILPLQHAHAPALADVLQPLVSKDGLLAAYAPTNSLVVIDAGANVDRLAGLLGEMDVPARGHTQEIVRLRFATAEDLAEQVRTAVPGAGPEGAGLRVVADARTNTLVLRGPPDEVRAARTLVGSLDQARPGDATRVHVLPLRHADAERLVRVLSHLLGLPVEAPPEPPARGSSFVRRSAERGRLATEAATTAPAPAVAAGGAPVAGVPLVGAVRLTADRATNALVVSAAPEDWQTLRPVIERLDVRRRQVFVEAIILEATVEKTRALGIEFRGATGVDGSTGLAQTNLGALPGALADPISLPGLLLAAASNRTVTLPDGSEVPAHALLLTALETESDVNVLSAPNVVTTDNEEAEIVVGRNVPFVASRATSATNLDNLFTTIERHDVGITLRMTPQIVADDYVRLTVFEEVSDLDTGAAAAVGDPTELGPTTTIRSASTTVAARHGQTVVLGGLLADTVRQGTRVVPYLGRLPVLGALFRRDDARRVKTNLLVFLTPHIIPSDVAMAATAEAQRDRMRRALPPARRDHPSLRAPSWKPPPEAGTP